VTTHETTDGKVPAYSIRLQSRHDLATTLTRFRDTIQARGMQLFAEIDQAKAAADVGMTLRPTTLFLFGSPKSGTPIMVANVPAALELPLRAVVWKDEQGAVFIDHQDVAALLQDQYGVPASLLEPMRGLPVLMRAIAGVE
jgi:uncharacterized protein (DUF302 family)